MGNRFAANPNVKVIIDQSGSDLRVRGWAKDEIKVSGDGPHATITEDGMTATISCAGDLDISIPENASLEIDFIGADAKITEVRGAIHIGGVGADLRLRDIGPLQLDSVGADLRIRQANSDVSIDHVGGDATLYEVSGNVRIDHIGGDAYFREIEGGCICNFIGGDLILQVDYKTTNEYNMNAGGDIICRVPAGANVKLMAEVLGDVAVEPENGRITSSEDNEYVIVFGAGEAVAKLEAHGDLQVVNDESFEFDFEEDLEGAFDIDLDRIMEQTTRAADRARRHAERIRDQVQREAERVGEEIRRQAERAAQEAQREAERAANRRSKGGKWQWSWDDGKMKKGFGFPTPPTPPMPPRPPVPPMPPVAPDEPVSNEERLLILKMVEAKQISVEDAEKLLAALEGRSINPNK